MTDRERDIDPDSPRERSRAGSMTSGGFEPEQLGDRVKAAAATC